MLALLALLASASAGFDVDAVGLSALERAAIVERARTELAQADLVDAPGLAACNEDTPAARAPSSSEPTGARAHQACAQAALTGAGAVAGAAVRVVKVLQVVRVELIVLDRDGVAVARSLRTLDVEGAAKGPLFDEAACAALASLAPRVQVAPVNADRVNASAAPGGVPFAALGAGVAGVALALAGGALATNEALLANSPSSSGDEKERARVLGPLAVGVAALGVVVAVAAPVVILAQ